MANASYVTVICPWEHRRPESSVSVGQLVLLPAGSTAPGAEQCWLTDRQTDRLTAAHGHSTDNASLLHVAHSSSLSLKLVRGFLRSSNPYLQRSNLLLLQDFPAAVRNAVTHHQEKVGPADDK